MDMKIYKTWREFLDAYLDGSCGNDDRVYVGSFYGDPDVQHNACGGDCDMAFELALLPMRGHGVTATWRAWDVFDCYMRHVSGVWA